MARRHNKTDEPATETMMDQNEETNEQAATDATEAATTEAAEAAKKGIFDRNKYQYGKSGVKTVSGRPAVDNGDAVAVAIRGKSAQEVIDLVAANGQEVPTRWSELNLGMQRMNAANVLRRLAKSEAGVQIDGETIRLATAEKAEIATAA